MSALVRLMGEVAPVGQLVFFRSLFAIVPVVIIYAYRGELRQAIHTKRPLGQLGRGLLSVGGMFFELRRADAAAAGRRDGDLSSRHR